MGNSSKKNPKYKSLKEQLKAENLGIVKISSDGNCLFRAISHQLTRNPKDHRSIRLKAMEYIKNNPDEFKNFMDEGSESFKNYVNRMMNDGQWGGNMELYALSKIYNAEIDVYISYQPICKICPSENPSKVIKLGYYNNRHYNSVVPKSEVPKNCCFFI